MQVNVSKDIDYEAMKNSVRSFNEMTYQRELRKVSDGWPVDFINMAKYEVDSSQLDATPILDQIAAILDMDDQEVVNYVNELHRRVRYTMASMVSMVRNDAERVEHAANKRTDLEAMIDEASKPHRLPAPNI